MGPTRSLRLPNALDAWFQERLSLKPESSASDLLVGLVHGGLRLRDGYMPIHRRALEHYALGGQHEWYRIYMRCLLDTFGPEYVRHLERWLESDGINLAEVPLNA
jgi:hypothetical protein